MSSCGWCLSEVAVEYEKEALLLKLQPISAIQQWRSTLASQEEGQGRDPRRERRSPGQITKIRARWTILFSPPVLWKGRPALCRTLPHASHSGGEEVLSERPHSAKGSLPSQSLREPLKKISSDLWYCDYLVFTCGAIL